MYSDRDWLICGCTSNRLGAREAHLAERENTELCGICGVPGNCYTDVVDQHRGICGCILPNRARSTCLHTPWACESVRRGKGDCPDQAVSCQKRGCPAGPTGMQYRRECTHAACSTERQGQASDARRRGMQAGMHGATWADDTAQHGCCAEHATTPACVPPQSTGLTPPEGCSPRSTGAWHAPGHRGIRVTAGMDAWCMAREPSVTRYVLTADGTMHVQRGRWVIAWVHLPPPQPVARSADWRVKGTHA